MNQELLKELKKITPEEQALLNGQKGINPSLYNLEPVSYTPRCV